MPVITLNPETHEYAVDGIKVPGVTKILESAGLIDFSMVPEDLMQRAKLYGEALHRTLEFEDKGILKTYDAALTNDLEAWRKFKADYHVEFLPDGIERKVMSKRWGVCGTLDRIGYIKKGLQKLSIVDIKSSTSFHPAIRLQTAGYKLCYEEEHGGKVRVQDRYGVRLNGDGTYTIEKYAEQNDEYAFIAAVQLYKWKQLHMKRGK